MKECDGCPVQALCLPLGRKQFLRKYVLRCITCGGCWLKNEEECTWVKRVGLPCMAFSSILGEDNIVAESPVQHRSRCPDCMVRTQYEQRRKRKRKWKGGEGKRKKYVV